MNSCERRGTRDTKQRAVLGQSTSEQPSPPTRAGDARVRMVAQVAQVLEALAVEPAPSTTISRGSSASESMSLVGQSREN